jgi:putative endonuclease
MDNKRKVGSFYEELTMEHLKKQGYIILEHNFYTRTGEADIVALEGEYLVFIEVKYRATSRYGSAAEAITPYKMRRIINVARFYCVKNKQYAKRPIRFDVVAIDGSEISIIKNAFEAY